MSIQDFIPVPAPDYTGVIVAFHIGRGGHFHNPGFYTFLPDVLSLQDCISEHEFTHYEDDEGNPLPDEEWEITDCDGEVMLKGRDECESVTGYLDRDGDYDTDVVCHLSDVVNEEMKAALYRAFKAEDIRDWDDRYPAIRQFLIEEGYSIEDEY